MNRWLMTMLASSVLVAACQTQEAEQTGTTEGIATDAAAVETQIEEQTTAFENAILAADPVALTALYTDDAVLMPPAMPRSSGSTAIQEAYEGMFAGATVTAAELQTDEIVVAESGEIAYKVGTYRMSGTLPDGTPWDDTGKFLETWRNVDGTWRIAVDIWNTDVPHAEKPAAAEGGETGMESAPAEEPAPEAETTP